MALTSRRKRRLSRRWLLRLKTLDRLHPQRLRAGPRRILDQRSPRYLEPRIPVPTRNCPPPRLPRQLKRKSKLGQTIRQRPLSRRWAEEHACIAVCRTKRQHKTSGAILPSNRSLPSNKNPLSQRAKSRRFMPWDPRGGSFRLRMLRPLPSRRKPPLPKRRLSQRKVLHPSGRRQIKAAPLPPCEALSKNAWTLRAKRTVLRPKRTALRTGSERESPGVPRRSSRLTSRIRLRLRQRGLIARTIPSGPNLALSYA